MPRVAPATGFDKLIGKWILAVRNKHELSQTAMGEVLGCAFQQIQKYESGANRLTVKSAAVILQRFPDSYDGLSKIMLRPVTKKGKSDAGRA